MYLNLIRFRYYVGRTKIIKINVFAGYFLTVVEIAKKNFKLFSAEINFIKIKTTLFTMK